MEYDIPEDVDQAKRDVNDELVHFFSKGMRIRNLKLRSELLVWYMVCAREASTEAIGWVKLHQRIEDRDRLLRTVNLMASQIQIRYERLLKQWNVSRSNS